MIRDQVQVAGAIALLNEMVKMDPEAAHALIEQRVSCNDTLRDHPTIQVQVDGGKAEVGLLGVLNGLLGADATGWGPIVACFDDDSGKLLRFEPSKAYKPSDSGEG